jgi:hypothetical protein
MQNPRQLILIYQHKICCELTWHADYCCQRGKPMHVQHFLNIYQQSANALGIVVLIEIISSRPLQPIAHATPDVA